MRDLVAGTTALVSINAAGADSGSGDANAFSGNNSWSPDGTSIVFASRASDLVVTDMNGARDIFVRDLISSSTTLVSINSAGMDSGNGGSYFAAWAPNGLFHRIRK